MEFWTLLMVALIVWWLWSSSQKKAAVVKEFKENQRRQELRIWEHEERDPTRYESYGLDFAEMVLKVDCGSYESPTQIVRAYHVYRGVNGAWGMRQTDASWGNDLAYVRRMAVETQSGATHSFWCDQLARLESGPAWQPFFETLAPSVETAYQRYVRQA